MKPEEIAKLLPWSKPVQRTTIHGERLFSKAKPDENFWRIWQQRRAELIKDGVKVSEWPRQSGKWEATWWQSLAPELIKQRAEALQASRATDAAIEIPAPPGFDYIGYQRAGVNFMANRYKTGVGAGVYLGDEMGLGKTIQAIGLINFDEKIHRVLVICPATLLYNWRNEMRKWLTRKMSVEVADLKCFPSSDVVIISYSLIHKFEKSLSYYWDLIVCDECHFLKNPASRRTKAVVGSRPKRKEVEALVASEGITKDQAKERLTKAPLNARRKLAMSGTPIENEPGDIFPVINWLDPKRWDNEFRFKLRYCNGKETSFGWSFDGASNTDELNRELRSGIMLRRMKRDVLKELPPKFRRIVELPNDDEASRAAVRAELEAFDDYYERLDRKAIAVELAKAGDSEEAYRAAIRALNEDLEIAFDEMAEVRHRTAIAKLPKVIEKLKEIFEEDSEHKLIVFFHHRDVAAALKKEFPNICLVVGGMDAQKKIEEVNRFQNDPKAQLFGGSLHAAGVGVTLTAASHVVFIEEDWKPSIISQAEDRAHRIGQHDNVLVEHWVLAGSLDVRMVMRTLKKQEMIESILDAETKAELEALPSFTADNPQTFNELTAESKALTEMQIAATVKALAILAQHGSFNKHEAALGRELASRSMLTPKQAALGRKLCLKYAETIGEELVNKIA